MRASLNENAMRFETLAIGVLGQCFASDRYSVDNLLFLPTSFYSIKVVRPPL